MWYVVVAVVVFLLLAENETICAYLVMLDTEEGKEKVYIVYIWDFQYPKLVHKSIQRYKWKRNNNHKTRREIEMENKRVDKMRWAFPPDKSIFLSSVSSLKLDLN